MAPSARLRRFARRIVTSTGFSSREEVVALGFEAIVNVVFEAARKNADKQGMPVVFPLELTRLDKEIVPVGVRRVCRLLRHEGDQRGLRV